MNHGRSGGRVVATRVNEKLYSMLLDYVSKSGFTSLSELLRFIIHYFFVSLEEGLEEKRD
jgi:hypothetical protein